MTTCKLAFTIESTSPELIAVVCVDGATIYNGSAINPTNILHDIDDSEGPHTLTLELRNKTPAHTKIDDQGNILLDEVIKVNNFTIDGINIDQILYELATYTHDFNGTSNQVVEKFYGTIGCNGVVRLEFATPIYIWLLEHL